MSATIVAAVLVAALLHASWNVFIRGAEDKSLRMLLVAGGAGAWSACWLPFVPLPGLGSWPYIAASVLIHLGYFSLLAYVYRNLDLSFAYPLMRGSAPALSALVAMVLLHEHPTRAGWLGILLVSFGVLMLAGDTGRRGSLRLLPTLLALANAGVIVVYTLVDGMGARVSGHSGSYTAWLFFLTALPLVAWHLARQGSKGMRELCVNWGHALLGGACTAGSYGVALWAMTQAPIALIASLRETSVVFGTLMAAGLLGEEVTALRYLAILVVTGGAVAIKLS